MQKKVIATGLHYYLCFFAKYLKQIMKKKTNNIITYFLLFAGLIIVFHSFVPHDHHYHLQGRLLQQPHHEQTGENLPLHCHYFNELFLNASTSGIHHEVIQYLSSRVVALPSRLQFQAFQRTILFKLKTAYHLSYHLTIPEILPTRGSPQPC